MIRKLILSAGIATATFAGLGLTPANADAAPYGRERGHGREMHRHSFEVLVRCGHGWENRGTYRDRFEADRAAERFRCEGFSVQVREC